MEKEIKIDVPEGYEIDKENSTFECIKFKPIFQSKYSDYDGSFEIKGFIINNGYKTEAYKARNFFHNKDIFATEKQAKSALAMAQITQIMINDKRFGGVITDNEWKDYAINKYCIFRYGDDLKTDVVGLTYHLLSFHTKEQRDLFLKENEQLVKDYLMLD